MEQLTKSLEEILDEKFREHYGSRVEFAKFYGVSAQNVYDVLRGKVTNIPMLEAAAKFLRELEQRKAEAAKEVEERKERIKELFKEPLAA